MKLTCMRLQHMVYYIKTSAEFCNKITKGVGVSKMKNLQGNVVFIVNMTEINNVLLKNCSQREI